MTARGTGPHHRINAPDAKNRKHLSFIRVAITVAERCNGGCFCR